jgi:hypothetical protein
VRMMFVHHVIEDRGSAQDMYHYVRAAEALGHEIALYGPPRPGSPFRYSLDADSADAVIFIFEWTTDLQFGGKLDYLRLVAKIPRSRRVVIDCDGKYNETISVIGDYNHSDAEASQRWIDVCDSLSDKICQPTSSPRRSNVQPFYFHAYSPTWAVPLEFGAKAYGMCYVGNNWFRWRPLKRVLEALAPIREQVGRIGLVGHGWDSSAPWASPTLIEDAYYTDPSYLRSLDIEVLPPVRFDQVVDSMSRGIFSPVILRPLFDHLRLVTCRTFETPAANTIPLFIQDPGYVEEIYGEEAVGLTLPENRPEERMLDLLRRPESYAKTVRDIRRRLSEKHSYMVRLAELVEIVES